VIFDEVVEPEVRAKVGVTSGGTETILLVEDSDSFRDLAREILEEHGYQVIEASSGAAALQARERHTGARGALDPRGVEWRHHAEKEHARHVETGQREAEELRGLGGGD
jgi:CheY-like chemotaxis protein